MASADESCRSSRAVARATEAVRAAESYTYDCDIVTYTRSQAQVRSASGGLCGHRLLEHAVEAARRAYPREDDDEEEDGEHRGRRSERAATEDERLSDTWEAVARRAASAGEGACVRGGCNGVWEV